MARGEKIEIFILSKQTKKKNYPMTIFLIKSVVADWKLIKNIFFYLI